MKTIYPDRKKAYFYIFTPIILFIISRLASVLAGNYNEGTHYQDIFIAISVLTLLISILFVVPFLVLGAKSWFYKINNEPLSPAEDKYNILKIQYSTSLFARIVGNTYSNHGIFKWNNRSKILRLDTATDGTESMVFKASYADIEKIRIDLNTITVKVSGATYTIQPYSSAIDRATYFGYGIASQAEAIGLGAASIALNGIPELAERLKIEGVKVIYSKPTQAIEKGIISAFIIAIVAMILIVMII